MTATTRLTGPPSDATVRKTKAHSRYQWAQVVNDFLLAGWFLGGNILFFDEHLQREASMLYFFGSLQMMVRALVHLAHKLHIRALEGIDF